MSDIPNERQKERLTNVLLTALNRIEEISQTAITKTAQEKTMALQIIEKLSYIAFLAQHHLIFTPAHAETKFATPWNEQEFLKELKHVDDEWDGEGCSMTDWNLQESYNETDKGCPKCDCRHSQFGWLD